MLGLILAFAVQASQPGVNFTTVETGRNSLVDQSRTVIVRTAGEWDALWKEHALDRERPNIDFAKETVVGVFLGSRPTAGFSVAITAVRTTGGVTTVEYVERRPNPDMMVAQVLTSPFHLVRSQRLPAPSSSRRILRRNGRD